MVLFEAKTSTEPDRLVVALAGECDLSVRVELTTMLLAAVQRSSAVAVDLSGLSFMDSSGIHALVTAHQAAQERGGHLYILHANGVVAEILDLTGVADLLRSPNAANQTAGERDDV